MTTPPPLAWSSSVPYLCFGSTWSSFFTNEEKSLEGGWPSVGRRSKKQTLPVANQDLRRAVNSMSIIPMGQVAHIRTCIYTYIENKRPRRVIQNYVCTQVCITYYVRMYMYTQVQIPTPHVVECRVNSMRTQTHTHATKYQYVCTYVLQLAYVRACVHEHTLLGDSPAWFFPGSRHTLPLEVGGGQYPGVVTGT